MPIYEYECSACGFRDDILQKLSDEPLTECPKCGKPEFQKLISAPSFRLKGGGWYETDFKSGSKRNIAESGGASSSSSSSDSTSSASTSTAPTTTTTTPKTSTD